MLAYDYIVVGAGAAGCVVAARLSEDPDVRVLLIEAGGSNWNPLLHAPGGLLPIMLSGSYSWGYQSVPQQHLGGRVLHLPRGKVIGGSSSINGMVYCRGTAADFNGWEPGWSYAEVLPYFKRTENWSHSASRSTQPDASRWHGDSGPVQVSRPGITHPFAQAFVEAGQQAGYPYNDDTNGAQRSGFGPVDVTVGNGRRSSAATAYLRPARNRANLTTVTNAHVQRVLFDGDRAVGVAVRRGRETLDYRAEREVILSGGALNSPQLLMLSGVGPADHLRGHGINVVQDLAGVGQNLQDHLAITVKYTSLEPISLFKYLSPLHGAAALARYVATRTGPLADPGMQAAAFVSSEPGIAEPDIKFLFLLALYRNHGRELIPQHGFGVHINCVRPDSVGQLQLASADPAAAPLIDQNYLSAEHDLRVMRRGVQIARDIFNRPAFDRYRGVELDPGPDVRSDAEIDHYIRTQSDADYHSCGTCRMGSDPMAVVDSELRVRGVRGLRVVDAAVMPRLVSGNTYMATVMIAEKAADLIAGKPSLAAANL